jgi:hypothetical protein
VGLFGEQGKGGEDNCQKNLVSGGIILDVIEICGLNNCFREERKTFRFAEAYYFMRVLMFVFRLGYCGKRKNLI